MAHRVGDHFDHDDGPVPWADYENAPEERALTIAERVQLGIACGRHIDEDGKDRGIVPFPADLHKGNIIGALTGDERRKMYGFRQHNYLPTVYETRDEEGRLIAVTVRFDHATERKVILPIRYCGKGKDGQDLYWCTWIPGTKPIYGLDVLAAKPGARVLVVEGEKAAEAARLLFPDWAVITWPCGARAVGMVEVIALAGRRVWFWPDNDAAGRGAMRLLAARVLDAGAEAAFVVDVDPSFGDGFDLADPLPAGFGDDGTTLQGMLEAARPVDPIEAAKLLRDPKRKAAQRRLLGHAPGHSRVDVDRFAEALAMLDPDMPGPLWFRVARCVYQAYGAAGLKPFDDWSGDGEKYKDGEPAGMWAGFAAEEGVAGPPLAWLFRMARKRAEEEQLNFELDAEAYMIANMEEVSADHAVVTRGGKTVVLWEKYDFVSGGYKTEYLDKTAFVDKLVQKVPLPGEDGKPGGNKPLGKLWFGSGWRRQYDGIYFAPGGSVGPREINSWRGFAVEPVENPAGWSLLKTHIRDNIAHGVQAHYDYIMDWLASAVQHLDRPVGTALILRGRKGAGKSILTMLFGRLFGAHTFVTSTAEDVVGRFSEHLETTLLLGVEEAFAPQNRAADGTLKHIVKSDTLRIEAKFHRPIMMPNRLRIIMTSNNDQVVRADPNDRRYAVFDVTNPYLADPAGRRRYFGAMVEQMETGGYEGMLGELLARDIRGWNAEQVPQTDALREQTLLNLANDPIQAWYYSRLEDGNHILSGDGGTTLYPWGQTETVWVPVQSVVADYTAFAKRHGKPGDDHRLKNKLARYMPAGFASKNKWEEPHPGEAPARDEAEVGGGGNAGRFQAVNREHQGRTDRRQCKHYPFPPLAEARELFTAATGYTFD